MWNPRGRSAPSRVWFGPGASAQIAEVVQELGVEPGPALLVTDGVVEELAPARGVRRVSRDATRRSWTVPEGADESRMEAGVRVADDRAA